MQGRTIRRGITPLLTLAAITVALALPGTASAGAYEDCVASTMRGATIVCYPEQPRLAGLRHTGWTWLSLDNCSSVACTNVYRTSAPAWRWTGTSWVRSSLAPGWVYVAPYTGQWRWAWTKRTGWVAVTGERFELRG